jgi:hypothetical protein
VNGFSDDGDAVIVHRRFFQAAHWFRGRWKNPFRRDTRITMTRFTGATRHRIRRCVRNRQHGRDKRKSYKEAQKAQRGSRELFVLYELIREHNNKTYSL